MDVLLAGRGVEADQDRRVGDVLYLGSQLAAQRQLVTAAAGAQAKLVAAPLTRALQVKIDQGDQHQLRLILHHHLPAAHLGAHVVLGVRGRHDEPGALEHRAAPGCNCAGGNAPVPDADDARAPARGGLVVQQQVEPAVGGRGETAAPLVQRALDVQVAGLASQPGQSYCTTGGSSATNRLAVGLEQGAVERPPLGVGLEDGALDDQQARGA